MTELKTKTQFREILGGLSRTTFWKLEKSDGDFPKPVSISPGKEFYLAHEIEAYLSLLAARRDGHVSRGVR